MSGYQSPNYTQTPNDLFDVLLPEMGYAELKVSLCILRNTLGYHRDGVTLSIRTIARMTGLTTRNVLEGAKAAEERGTLTRAVSSTMTTTWLPVIAKDTVCIPRGNRTVSPGKGKLPVKESKESNKENTTTTTANIFKVYEQNIGPLTPLISEDLTDLAKTYTDEWVRRAMVEAATSNVRNLKYIKAVLAGYKERGSPDIGRTPVKETGQRRSYTQPAPYSPVPSVEKTAAFIAAVKDGQQYAPRPAGVRPKIKQLARELKR
jgi:DnaD/phage-associated family protein